MLDLGVPINLTNDVWEALPDRADLPRDQLRLLAKAGGARRTGVCRRAFQRLKAEARAIIRTDDRLLAAYLQDLSAAGVGLVSPEQLFPQQFVTLLFASTPADRFRQER